MQTDFVSFVGWTTDSFTLPEDVADKHPFRYGIKSFSTLKTIRFEIVIKYHKHQTVDEVLQYLKDVANVEACELFGFVR